MKSKNIIITVVAVLVGYSLGTVIGWPETSRDLVSGNVSKVSKFHKNTVNSQTSALEEKLKNDTAAFNQEKAMVNLINSRMIDFSDLVDYTVIAASDKEELKKEVNSLINVRNLSGNAVQAGKIAIASLEYLESGEQNELVTGYEQASQNLVVAFMMVDRQVQLGKQFVVATDKYLNGKSLEEAPEIAVLRDLWAGYCAESAWLNKDSQEITYWEEKSIITNSDIIDKGVQKLCNIDKNRLESFDRDNLINNLDRDNLINNLDRDNLINNLDRNVLENFSNTSSSLQNSLQLFIGNRGNTNNRAQ